MSSVAVVGVGAVGGFFAAQAYRAGNDVTLCVRRPFDELIVESKGEVIRVTAEVATDPARVGPVDWVLLATKAHQTPSTAGWLERLCTPETVVVVVQNGIDPVERVRPFCPVATILPSVAYCGGELVAPGHVIHRSYGHLIVPEGDAGARLRDIFAGSTAEIRLTGDYVTAEWLKMCSNVAGNAVTALTLQRFPVFRRPDIADLGTAISEECIAVAAAAGAKVERSFARATVERLASLSDDSATSMLYDRLAGRELEHEVISGAVVAAGARYGIPTPLNAAMNALLAAVSGRPLTENEP